MNQKFKGAGLINLKVNNIIDDFKDGMLFLEFLEVMSGKKFPEADKKKVPNTLSKT